MKHHECKHSSFCAVLRGGKVCCRFTECSEIWTQTTDYFQVVGIILGQLTVGFLGDWLGRRWGMIQVWDAPPRLDHFWNMMPLLVCDSVQSAEAMYTFI